VSADDFSLVAEAGCTLASIQQAAEDVDRFFPLSLAAEGSCQIGGNLSTNAGGINVLRYGTARAQALGLEVVLADGTVWDGLRTLRKDTAGYDLKQMFIGAEGTLGVITAIRKRCWLPSSRPMRQWRCLRLCATNYLTSYRHSNSFPRAPFDFAWHIFRRAAFH
jgi:FAD/FMN-containing dehydrogenase